MNQTMMQMFMNEGADLNSARLKGCAGPHVFNSITPEIKDVDQQVMKCEKCGGLLGPMLVEIYMSGVTHGTPAPPAPPVP
ncbi:MAG: hypothetical protein ABIL58_10415 [Pseudomonadota bacterium]